MTDPKRIDPRAALEPLVRLARDAGAARSTESDLARGLQTLLARVDRSPARTRRAPWFVAAAMLAVAALTIALTWPRRALQYSIEGGLPLDTYVLAGPSGAALRFTEGTEIRFQPGARGRVTEVTARGARVSIEAGSASFRVTHLPGASWVAEAGPFAVEVTGTEFDVTWERDRLDVAVRVGSVIVRGPLASGGVPLAAGHRLVADLGHGELKLTAIAKGDSATPAPDDSADSDVIPADSAPPALDPSMLPSADARAQPEPPQRAPLSWKTRVANGDFAGVLADAEARGLDASLDGTRLSELAALADAARYAGRSDIAKRALLAERKRFAGSAEGRSAAFLIGRIIEQGSPAAAIDWYDRYLSESPSGALASEALGRKMVLLAPRLPDAARAAAEEYKRRFPHGALAAAADALLAPAAPATSATP